MVCFFTMIGGDELARLKKSFSEDGYVVIRGAVPKETLEALRLRILAEFARVKASGELFVAGGSITGHLNCFPGEGARAVYDALVDGGVISALREIFPKPAPVLKVGCNFNLPKSVVQHYHHDGAFMKEFIECNVAVVDTDIENGAIDVVPGTHKKFYKYWQFALQAPYRNSKRIPLKQGDILIRTSNLWHRGMPNMSNEARPMLAFTWENSKDSGVDPFVENRGEIIFKKNWFRTDFLGQLRERAYVAAPFTYSAYRFVSSFFGNRGYSSY